jgi:hypothetical protein
LDRYNPSLHIYKATKDKMDSSVKPKTLRELWYPGLYDYKVSKDNKTDTSVKSKTLRELCYPSLHDYMTTKDKTDSNVKPKTLREHWYPSGSVQPSRSPANKRTQMINMHSTFTGTEDAYSYPRESLKAKIAASANKIKALEFERHFQFNQVLTPMCIACDAPDHVVEECPFLNHEPAPICTGCDAPDHIVEECPYLMSPIQNRFTQGVAAYESYMNEPHAPTHTPGYGHHPNFMWSQDATLGSHNLDQPYLWPNQALNDQPDFDLEGRTNILEKTLEVFMQTTGQILNSNTQAIARLDMQVSQLASVINKQEEDILLEGNLDGPELHQEDQFDQFRSEKLEEIPEIENTHEVSIVSDHNTHPRLEVSVEPLMTLVDPLAKKEEDTNGDLETLPLHIEYINLDLVEPRSLLKLYLDLNIEKELLATGGSVNQRVQVGNILWMNPNHVENCKPLSRFGQE